MKQLSRSARFYKKNKKARDKKNAYQKKYNQKPEEKARRVELNRERRRRKLKGNPKDLSHKKDGTMVLESKRKNRARNGHDGKSTKKD